MNYTSIKINKFLKTGKNKNEGQEDPLEKEWSTHSSILGLPWWLSW